jgi:hypothetical protein
MHHQFEVACLYFGGGRDPLIRDGMYCTQQVVISPREIGKIFDLHATDSASAYCSPVEFTRRAGFKTNDWKKT